MSRLRTRAFTLVELLIATAILSVLVLLLTSLLSGVNRAWVSGEQQVSEFQDGRAICELISRELSQAVVSQNLQLVENPSLPPGLNPGESDPARQRANSDSIFWQAPATSTASGNLAEIGYYLTESYQLKRFFVPPDNNKYAIFSNAPTDISAPWITTPFASPSEFNAVCSVVSQGVLSFWVRCFDRNGDLIPWLSTAPPLKFNSAAHFQPAIIGQPSSFKYTSASTARGNLLPTALEVTVVTLDPQTFKRNPTIPALPTWTAPDQLPAIRDSFSQQLITNTIKTARTFTTRANLLNAGQ
jgi:prepilin-type N-terminal cleavage/methylation domain-containing protein